jgi:3-oxoadipate enol-lactonase
MRKMTIAQHKIRVAHSEDEIAVCVQGPEDGPVVFMAHAILTASALWEAQARLLAEQGWRVVRADTRGHGGSTAPAGPYSMDQLAGDVIAVLDALRIDRVHYIGLSLGGMTGFGLGLHHANRLLSLCICDARADAPPAFAAPWDERIAIAEKDGCAALAAPTVERWFGPVFLTENPEIRQHFLELAASTAIAGFVGCARAIQGLDYLRDISRIALPVGLIVGANDSTLPQAMQDIQGVIPGAILDVIAGAGHLPNIDQSEAFNAALLRHLARTR